MGDRAAAKRADHLSWPRQLAVSSLFWLSVLLALEPGNLLRWQGGLPTWGEEILRLFGASLLGGAGGLVIFWLVSHYPIRAQSSAYRIAAHAGAVGVLTLVILSLANVFASAFLQGPGLAHLPMEIAANFSLLVAGLAALDLMGHFWSPSSDVVSVPHIDHVTVKDKDGAFQLPLEAVEYIEAQENYVALHTGAGSYLIRATFSSFAEKLGADEFLRIHRSIVVRRSCICRVRPVGNGKMQLKLRSGREVVASRAYAGALRTLSGVAD